MTMTLGPYAVFIVTAYAAAAAIIMGLIAWIVLDYRHLVRALGELEAQGITRRSERADK
jgi:heme exporter protein D